MSRDKLKIDSHKLIYHPQRVADWLKGKNIYPIYIEVGPAGLCNCRCLFCTVDYIGYQNRFLATGLLKKRLTEMVRLGVKSVMFAGEGEPFLHRDLPEIVVHTKESGIDVAITTNGILMKPGISEKILGHCEWIKVSCNAGTPESYAHIHQTRAKYFNKVLSNLEHAVKVRTERGHSCTLGLQIILLPENENDLVKLADICREIGLDYLVVKPYTRHYRNAHDFQVQYDKYSDAAAALKAMETESFKVIFRAGAMQVWDSQQRGYEECLALPFWSHIDAGGNVWGCGAHLEDDSFLYGNINQHTFKEIWEGDKRQMATRSFAEGRDISQCRYNCRMGKINQYLWELKHPVEHVNFI